MTRISQKVLPLISLLLLTMSAGLPARAAADQQGPSQQGKMKACNNLADNKGLKGDDSQELYAGLPSIKLVISNITK